MSSRTQDIGVRAIADQRAHQCAIASYHGVGAVITALLVSAAKGNAPDFEMPARNRKRHRRSQSHITRHDAGKDVMSINTLGVSEPLLHTVFTREGSQVQSLSRPPRNPSKIGTFWAGSRFSPSLLA
jgi:hypothetical protein